MPIIEDRVHRQYWEELTPFLKEKCVGPEFDSCHDSPCRYSSSGGCTHPEHPMHKFVQAQGGGK